MAKTDINQKRSIWFPGESSWEQWFVVPGREPQLIGGASAADRSFALNARGRRFLALPVSSVVALPLLSNATDTDGLEATARMQAERSGIAADLEGVGFEVLTGTPRNTLLRVDAPVQGSHVWEGVVFPDQVCASAAMLPWTGDTVAVWRELGKLVVAFTRNGRLIYFDQLSVSGVGAECGNEIQRLLFQLNCQGIELRPEVLDLWTAGGDPAVLQNSTGLAVRQGKRPAPIAQNRSSMTPGWLRQHQLVSARRKVIRKRLSVMAAAAMMVVGALTAMGVVESIRQRQLLEQIGELSPIASRVENMKAQWLEVAPAVDRDATPLEVLKALQSTPGASGVNLSRVEIDEEKVVIEGESPTTKAAFQFLDEISISEAVAEYGWEFDQPEIQANGAATFKLEGVK